MNIYDLIDLARVVLDKINFIRFVKEMHQTTNEKQQLDLARKYQVIK